MQDDKFLQSNDPSQPLRGGRGGRGGSTDLDQTRFDGGYGSPSMPITAAGPAATSGPGGRGGGQMRGGGGSAA